MASVISVLPRVVPRIVPERLTELVAAGAEPVRLRIVDSMVEMLAGPEPGDATRGYDSPAGDPGLFGPDSVTWRVHADAASMMIGGVAALMLQTLHPLAMAGVEEHSNYREDPLGRLRRTGEFVGAVTFGSTSMAEQAIEIVARVHTRVRGTAPDGRIYSADDPELLCWVHTSEYSMFLRSYQRHAERRLTRTEQDQYLAEVAEVAVRLGATWVPRSVDELESYFERVRPELYRGPQARRTLRFLQEGAFPDPASRAVYQLIQRSAQATLPGWARRMCRLEPMPVVGRLAEAAALRPGTDAFLAAGRWILGEPPQLAAARARAAASSSAPDAARSSAGRRRSAAARA